MPLLIDGHNLIGQMHDMSLSDPDDEEKLIVRIRGLAEQTRKRITLVFDPNPHDATPHVGQGKSQYGSLTVIYAPYGQKADDIIRHHVGDVKDKQGLVVVTSDRAVADFTRRCGVRVQSSADFITWMNALRTGKLNVDAKPVGSAREVINWGEVFKEPPPSPSTGKTVARKPARKGATRSEQLKAQVKKTRPLF
jgi:uncharacterized protein